MILQNFRRGSVFFFNYLSFIVCLLKELFDPMSFCAHRKGKTIMK